MPKITLEVSEELSQQLAQVGDRLPELLALSLQQPAIPAEIYRYILHSTEKCCSDRQQFSHH